MAKWNGKVALSNGSTIITAHRNGTSRRFGYDPLRQLFYDCHASEKEAMTAEGFKTWKAAVVSQGFFLEIKMTHNNTNN